MFRRLLSTALWICPASLLAITLGIALPGARAEKPSPTPSTVRWQYKCIGSPPKTLLFSARLAKLEESANKLGAAGWELAGSNDGYWCFKRRAP